MKKIKCLLSILFLFAMVQLFPQVDISSQTEVKKPDSDLVSSRGYDLGVNFIISPHTGFDLSTLEPVILWIKNYGDQPISEIPWQIVLEGPSGADTITGTINAILNPGITIELEAGTVDLSIIGEYWLSACTQLPGDENTNNDCIIWQVLHLEGIYCNASTSIHDEFIARVQCGSINKYSVWQGGVADYTNNVTYILPGQSESITITNGHAWVNDRVSCWVDWNKNYIHDLQSNEEFVLENVGGTGETFMGQITVPENTPDGHYRMRIRMTYDSDPQPCGMAQYGELEDYTIRVGDTLANDVGMVSIDNGAFYSPGLVLPMATIKNFGLATQDFTTTLSIGNYISTKTVIGLAGGEELQLSFDNWFADEGTFMLEVCTELIGDDYAANDCLSQEINIAEGKYAYGFNYVNGEDSIVRFDINNPESMFMLVQSPSLATITAACWGNNSLLALASNGTLYNVNPETLDMTVIDTIMANNGLAYDGTTFYACSDSMLFKINPETGQELLIGNMGNPHSMTGIACDTYGNLYGAEYGVGNFYSINKTTGEATLIGNLGYDFTGLQDMAFDKETNTCYISAYVSSQLKGLFQVDVFTGAATLLYNYPDNIRIMGLAIPYSTFPPAGPAPEGFMASYEEGMGVQCAWGYPPPETWIGYDDGTNNDGLGLDGGGTYWGAIRFEPEDLMEYDNSMITQVAFFPRKFANASEMTLMIWEGADAANLVYQQTMTGLNWNEWNEVELDLAHYIDATIELWIGFQVEHPANEYPLGYDFGPAVAGYGDMVSFDGQSWETLSNYDLDFNFNLKALVVEDGDAVALEKSIIQTKTISNPGGKLLAGNLKTSAVPAFVYSDKSLLGYNVYRNNVQINTGLISPATQEYLDDFHTIGTYIYTAKAVYDEGLSDHSNPATVTILGATIAVDPDTIVETHENPPQITTRTLTITNDGNIPLDWAITDFKNTDILSFANDVGVSTINAPTSGMIYTDAEPVIFTIKNFGTTSQSNILWELSWEGSSGGDIISDIYTGSLASGEMVEIVADTIDMTSFGDYTFEACTFLSGDDNPDNDCKTKYINYWDTYCIAGTAYENEYIANVHCGSINNSSTWQGGVANYTPISTIISAGHSRAITITNGNAWASNMVTCWVDWNFDYEFDLLAEGNEAFHLLNVGGTGETFQGYITVPEGTPAGEYRMRVRMTYSTAPDPCGSLNYGEVEDYTIIVGNCSEEWLSFDQTSGSIPAGESVDVELSFNSDGLLGGSYSTSITITSNAQAMPVLEIPLTFDVITQQPVINVDAGIMEFYLDYPETDTKEIYISNEGGDDLNIDMSITYGLDAAVLSANQNIEYKNVISPELFGLANAAHPTPSPNLTDDEVIRYDDGVNSDAIGLSAGGTFQVSAYWPASTMEQYAGIELASVEVYINDEPSSFILKIYDQGTATVPGKLLHEQIVAVSPQLWNVIELSRPVAISGNDIWIGYQISHAEGVFSAGCDAGPAVVGYGDMISLNDTTFEPMSGFGLDYNWNIAATLVGEIPPGGWLSVYPTSAIIGGGAMETFELTADTYPIGPNYMESFFAYLYIESNDPLTPMVQIPVALHPRTIGINEVYDDAYLLIYPNPAGDRVNISSNYPMGNYQLLNHQGQVVMKGSVTGKTFSINTNHLKAGIYYISINSEAGESSHKLIVE